MTIAAYDEPARAGLDLATNANLFGRNPALDIELPDATNYPAAGSPELRAAAAKFYDVPAASVMSCNGSDEALDLIMRACVSPGDVVKIASPTFAMAKHYAAANGAVVEETTDPEVGFAGPAALRYLCRPNNPTGAVASRELINTWLDLPGVLLVDEAYAEFAPDALMDLIGHPRLVILRTLSKAHGLAGLRVGFAIGPPEIIAAADAIGGPYRINAWSAAVATKALQSKDFLVQTVAQTAAEKPLWENLLREHGFAPWSTHGNFLYFKGNLEHLQQHDISVRQLGEYCRITIGPPAAREALARALEA